jgi:hypothetical protein
VRDRHEAMLDVGGALGLVGVLMPARIPRVLTGDAAGLSVQRGGEKECLALTRHLGDYPVDGRAEAHVEHPVGLVEGEHPDAVEPDGAARDQVLEPAGGGHDDVRLAGELDLALEADAAVYGGHGEGARRCDVPDRLDDLARKLARRREHQRRGAGVGGLDPVDQRHAERERLARPGRGLHEHVVTRQHVGDDRRLNGKRTLQAVPREGSCDHRRYAEVGEGLLVHSAPDGGRSNTAASYLGDSPDPDR